jgi:hypothetical protein
VSLMTDLRELNTELHSAGIHYALIGGMALGFRGVMRATADIDFLVLDTDRHSLAALMQKLGCQVFHESDNVAQFKGRYAVDVLFAKRPISQSLLDSSTVFPPLNIPVLSVEGLIGLKIQAYKNDPRRILQDKADIQALMRVNQSLDLEEVVKFAALFAEAEEVKRIWNEK